MINLDNIMPTTNKKRIVCFVEQRQLREIESVAAENKLSRSEVIRRRLEYGRGR